MTQGKQYKKIAVTIVASGVAFVVNYFISFFLAPFITERVGTEAYGFVTMAKDFAVYATFITVAINAYATRFISVEYFKPDIKQANVYFSSTFWGDLFLGSLIFAGVGICILNLERLLQIPPDIVTDVKLLFLFVFIKFLVTTLFNVYSSGAYISNHLDVTNVFKGVSYCVEAATLLILFKLFRAHVFYVGMGILAAALVIALSNMWICKRYTPELKIRREDYSGAAVKTLVVNGVWSSVSQLGNLLNSGLDLTVCNLLISAYAMGQLSITHSISVIFLSLYAMVSEAFKPMILRIYSKNDMPALTRELKIAVKMTSLVASVFFAGFLSLGLVYYKLWIPHQDIELLYQLTLVVIGANLLPCIESPLFYIYTLTLTRKVSCIFTLISGVLNVLSMYVLIKYLHFGIFAVVGTTLVLESIIHLFAHPLYMAHVLRIPWHSFYPEILCSLLSIGLLSLAFVGLSKLYMPSSWLTLIACAIVYSAVGTALHFILVFNKQERAAIIAKVRKKLRK